MNNLRQYLKNPQIDWWGPRHGHTVSSRAQLRLASQRRLLCRPVIMVIYHPPKAPSTLLHTMTAAVYSPTH